MTCSDFSLVNTYVDRKMYQPSKLETAVKGFSTEIGCHERDENCFHLDDSECFLLEIVVLRDQRGSSDVLLRGFDD